MNAATQVRNLANLVNGSTALGLLYALISQAKLERRDGLIIANDAVMPGVKAGALTLGSVVLVPGQSIDDLQKKLPHALRHENEHAWQYAYFLGLPMLPLYVLASLWSWLRTGNRASANPFEVGAGLSDGGYKQHPKPRT